MTDPPASEHGHLDVRLFGPCRILRNGVEVQRPAPQPAAALKILALRGGVIQRDKLVAALWPDEDIAVARARLRNVLSKLRRATGVRIQERKDSVLVLDRVRCDVVEFIQLAGRAVAAADQPRKRNQLCVEALALWVGPPLEEDCFAVWAQSHRRRAFELQRAMWAFLPPTDSSDIAPNPTRAP